MPIESKRPSKRTWLAIAMAVVVTALAAALAGSFAQQRAINDLRDRALTSAELNSALARNVLERHRTLPYVLSQDISVLSALDQQRAADILALDASLESLSKGVGASAIYVLDRKGHTIAASNWREPATFVGVNYEFRPYFQDAIRTGHSEHFALGTVSHRAGLYLAHRVVDHANTPVGVVVVKVDLSSLEAEWQHQREAVFVTDEHGVVILTSEPSWRYRALDPLNAHTANALKTTFQYGNANLETLTFPTIDDASGLVGPPEQTSSTPQPPVLGESSPSPADALEPSSSARPPSTPSTSAGPASSSSTSAASTSAPSTSAASTSATSTSATSTSATSTSATSTSATPTAASRASPPSEKPKAYTSPLNLLTVLPVEKMTNWTLHTLTPVYEPLAQARTNAQLSTALACALLFLVISTMMRKRQRTRRIALERQRVVNELEREVAARTQQLETTHAHLTSAMEDKLQTQKRVQDLQEDLAQANKLTLLGQVTAGVAHEINQPLAAITSYSENAALLLQRQQNEAALKNLNSIQHLAHRIGRITAELRSFSRRTRADSNHSTSVREAIEGALLLINASNQNRQVLIEFEPPPHDLHAAINKIHLEQILVNLLQNARDAVLTEQSPRIAIRVEDPPPRFDQRHCVRITVTDNGPGLSDELLSRLFVPFSSSKSEGLGLGLVISRDLAREAGGELSGSNLGPSGLNSGPSGAQFVLELPRSIASEQQKQGSAPKLAPDPDEGRTQDPYSKAGEPDKW